MLMELVGIYGEGDWGAIGKAMGVATRTVKERYMRDKYNHGPWTTEEENDLRRWVKFLGNRWASIAQAMGTNRSRQELRNRWLKICDLSPEPEPPQSVVSDDGSFYWDE
jgi:hypothetical protein